MARITVTTTPTRLDVDDAGWTAGRSGLYRCPSADLYLERTPAATTTANGYLLPAGTPFGEDIIGSEQLYAVVATGTADVHVLRAGVA